MKYFDFFQHKRVEKFQVGQNCIHKVLKKLILLYKKFQTFEANKEKRIYFSKRKLSNINRRMLVYIEKISFVVERL